MGWSRIKFFQIEQLRLEQSEEVMQQMQQEDETHANDEGAETIPKFV